MQQGIISGGYPGRAASVLFIVLVFCVCFAILYSGYRNRSVPERRVSTEQLIGIVVMGCLMIGIMLWQIAKHSS